MCSCPAWKGAVGRAPSPRHPLRACRLLWVRDASGLGAGGIKMPTRGKRVSIPMPASWERGFLPAALGFHRCSRIAPALLGGGGSLRVPGQEAGMEVQLIKAPWGHMGGSGDSPHLAHTSSSWTGAVPPGVPFPWSRKRRARS